MLRSVKRFLNQSYARRYGVLGIFAEESRVSWSFFCFANGAFLLQKSDTLDIGGSQSICSVLQSLWGQDKLGQALTTIVLGEGLCRSAVLKFANLPTNKKDLDRYILWQYDKNFRFDQTPSNDSILKYRCRTINSESTRYLQVSEIISDSGGDIAKRFGNDCQTIDNILPFFYLDRSILPALREGQQVSILLLLTEDRFYYWGYKSSVAVFYRSIPVMASSEETLELLVQGIRSLGNELNLSDLASHTHIFVDDKNTIDTFRELASISNNVYYLGDVLRPYVGSSECHAIPALISLQYITG